MRTGWDVTLNSEGETPRSAALGLWVGQRGGPRARYEVRAHFVVTSEPVNARMTAQERDDMTLQMIDSVDPIRIENVVLHVFADPGAGRTTLGNMAEKVLLADFDNGVHRSLGRQRVARLEAWEEMEELLKHQWFDACGLFVVDTVGRAIELLTHSIIVENSKCGSLSTGLNQHGWGVLRTRFVSFFSSVRRRKKNIIMLSHAKLDKDREGNKTAVPDIPGGSAGEVFKVSDAIAYLEVRGGKRILDFNITDYHIGKNPPNWKPFEIPEYAKAPRFLGERIITPLIDHLNSLSEEQRVVLEQVGQWQATVEALESKPEAFTKAIPLVEKIEHPAVKAQVRTLLWRRAKLVGFDYDKAAGKFVAIKKAEAVSA